MPGSVTRIAAQWSISNWRSCATIVADAVVGRRRPIEGAVGPSNAAEHVEVDRQRGGIEAQRQQEAVAVGVEALRVAVRIARAELDVAQERAVEIILDVRTHLPVLAGRFLILLEQSLEDLRREGSVKLTPVTVKEGCSRSKFTVRGPGQTRSIDSVEPRKVDVVRATSTLKCKRS